MARTGTTPPIETRGRVRPPPTRTPVMHLAWAPRITRGGGDERVANEPVLSRQNRPLRRSQSHHLLSFVIHAFGIGSTPAIRERSSADLAQYRPDSRQPVAPQPIRREPARPVEVPARPHDSRPNCAPTVLDAELGTSMVDRADPDPGPLSDLCDGQAIHRVRPCAAHRRAGQSPTRSHPAAPPTATPGQSTPD